MPNFITNILTITDVPKSRIKHILNNISNDDRAIDFNKIIPMPESLRIESGTKLQIGLSLFYRNNDIGGNRLPFENTLIMFNRYNDEQKDEIKNLADIGIKNILEYGHATWYDWSIENWGTKWNACNSKKMENGIIFDTAWSTPFNVILHLSQQFPDATIVVNYADEDVGQNCGGYILKNGWKF